MKVKKTLTVIIACIVFLTAKGLFAEGQADRTNDTAFGPVSAELLIQHINSTFGATAAGNEVINTEMEKDLNHLEFSYQGQRQQPKYKEMSASDYKKAAFGSNH